MSIALTLKRMVYNLMPEALRSWRERYLDEKFRHSIENLPLAEQFEKIYRDGKWGKHASGQPFFSGSGSHVPSLVDGYVVAIESFLRTFTVPPDCVDIGCGDFAIGSRIRPLCGRYVACDIVRPLIEFNRSAYSTANVDFIELDFTREPPPAADVAFVRQVFQHLSNAQIDAAVKNMVGRFKYLVVTEHLPSEVNFPPNREKPSGADVRATQVPCSGVVLDAAPFNLCFASKKVVFSAKEAKGSLVTTIYKMV